MRAFAIRPDQLIGPDWMRTDRFDIQAAMPPNSTSQQVPEMLRVLLEERFGLVTPRERLSSHRGEQC